MTAEAVPRIIEAAGASAVRAYREFLDDPGLSPSTRNVYGRHVRRFFRWAEARGLALHAVTATDLAAATGPLKRSSAQDIHSALRCLFLHFVGAGVVAKNPFSRDPRGGRRVLVSARAFPSVLDQTELEGGGGDSGNARAISEIDARIAMVSGTIARLAGELEGLRFGRRLLASRADARQDTPAVRHVGKLSLSPEGPGPRSVRPLHLAEVMRLSDEEALEAFKRIRWSRTGGRPVCPRCGCAEHYTCKAESRWKCKACGYRFSATSGTIFGSRKLPLRQILVAIAILDGGDQARSALQLSRDLDVQYRTAWQLARKIRKAIERRKHGRGQDGVMEIGAACEGGHPEPTITKEDPCDRRLAVTGPACERPPAADGAGPSIPLAELKRIVLKIGEPDGWIEDSEDFRAGLVMLAPLSIHSRDPALVARFTGVPEPEVAEYARRLTESGIWLPDGSIGSDWDDPGHGNLAFMMDVWVALGQLERRTVPEAAAEIPPEGVVGERVGPAQEAPHAR